MPVKNTKRRTNDGLEGVITGLTEEEKKILNEAVSGGALLVNTVNEMNALLEEKDLKDGQLCYCKETTTLYVLENNTWVEAGGGTAVEANPQEEATQQLNKIKIDNIAYNIAGGGSGGLSVSVTKLQPKTKNGNNQLVKWKNDEGFQELKANTAYEVGDSFVVRYQNIVAETLQENQIMSPVDVYISLTKSQTTLTYGGVTLSCGGERISTYYTNTSANKPSLTVSCYITYNVVKAGTTGANVEPPSPSTYLSYIIYTLGLA